MKGESDIHPSIHRCRADVAAFQSLTHLYSVSLLRTTEWTSSWDSSGTTLGWPTASTPTTRWTLTPLCWTPSGNLTCSSLTRRAPTSTRSPPTTSCYASLKTATCSTAYGEWRKCEVSHANCFSFKSSDQQDYAVTRHQCPSLIHLKFFHFAWMINTKAVYSGLKSLGTRPKTTPIKLWSGGVLKWQNCPFW